MPKTPSYFGNFNAKNMVYLPPKDDELSLARTETIQSISSTKSSRISGFLSSIKEKIFK
jgi:hypothetical protein